MIEKIQGGTLGGKSFAVNLANGGEVVEFNPDYAVPADVMTLAEEHDRRHRRRLDGRPAALTFACPTRSGRGRTSPAPSDTETARARPPPALRSAASSCEESSSAFRASSPMITSA